jgi:hypothetical protein
MNSTLEILKIQLSVVRLGKLSHVVVLVEAHPDEILKLQRPSILTMKKHYRAAFQALLCCTCLNLLFFVLLHHYLCTSCAPCAVLSLKSPVQNST